MMQETTRDSDGIDTPKRAWISRIPRWCWLATLVVVGPVILIWKGFPPDVPREPVILARDSDGALRQQGSPRAGLALNAQLGTLKANNQTSCVSSSGHSNPAFFAARHLIIINQSDDVLMERVGAELIESLKSELAFDRLEYYPHGHLPETGKPAPDFYLMLELRSKTVSGLMNDQLQATVKALLGSTPVRSRFNSFDQLSPPLVRLHAEVEVEHESTYFGVESSGATYVLQGRDIAKQITARLKTSFEKAREGHQPVPELPVELAEPEWSPVPDFEFLRNLNAEVLTSTHRLMTHNETFWRLKSDGTTAELFADVKGELAGSGWRVDHEQTTHPRSSILRLVQKERDLIIFPADREQLPASADGNWPETADYFVRYRDRMSLDAVRLVIDEVLTQQKPDIGLLLLFHNQASQEQRSKIVSLLEQHRPGIPDSWIVLARHYSRQNDIDGCRRALRRLMCFQHVLQDPAGLRSRIQDIAEENGIDDSEYSELTEDDWLATGFVQITPSSDGNPVEFGFDGPAAFFAIDDRGESHVFSITVNSGPDGELTATRMHSADGARSWSSGSIFHHGQEEDRHRFGNGLNGRYVVMTTTRLAPDRFRTVARIEGAAPVRDGT